MTSKEYLDKLIESIDTLSDILDTEGYGLCIVDSDGIIVKWNYEKFLHIKASEAVGHHVTDILENSRLHIVTQTGEKELFQLQDIKGRPVICNRIPLVYNNVIVGAAGTILFKDTNELGELHHRMEKLKDNFRAYQSEIAKMYTATYRFEDIKTHDSKMDTLKKMCKRIAISDASVLIQGESGTGKELFAQSIHTASFVSNQPFVSINCASVPKELLESELFGYENGAFTGARKEGRIGKFELVGNGTLFLDELGTMPADMQVKLLRVLENREFYRLGGNKKMPFNARVIAATNENLKEAIAGGQFRSDLYYRLNVITVDIPPLRNRINDIECLCEDILSQKSTAYLSEPVHLSEAALTLLKHHDWPGNVRELRNVIERALIICTGPVILPEHLPDYIQAYADNKTTDSNGSYYKKELAHLEYQMISRALADHHWNKKEAAKQLGIHRSLLYKKMEALNIREL